MSQTTASAEPPAAVISAQTWLQLFQVAGDGDDVQSVLGQSADDGRADAARSAGDEGYPFFGHGLPLYPIPRLSTTSRRLIRLARPASDRARGQVR